MENQGHNENKTVSREGVFAAFRRLEGIVVRTPLLPVPEAEGRLWIKCESLQLGGAFKFRGAYNRLARLTVDQRQAGVVAFSSGNHAQGVALAAKLHGVPAVIIMLLCTSRRFYHRWYDLGIGVVAPPATAFSTSSAFDSARFSRLTRRLSSRT